MSKPKKMAGRDGDRAGWVHLWRKLIRSEVWELGPRTIQIWIYLLLRARGAPGPVTTDRGVVIERGQLITSCSQIAEATKFRSGRGFRKNSVDSIRRSLNRLEEIRNIARKSAGAGMLITICNYDIYNPLPPNGRREPGRRSVSNGAGTTLTNKKEKNAEEGQTTGSDSEPESSRPTHPDLWSAMQWINQQVQRPLPWSTVDQSRLVQALQRVRFGGVQAAVTDALDGIRKSRAPMLYLLGNGNGKVGVLGNFVPAWEEPDDYEPDYWEGPES